MLYYKHSQPAYQQWPNEISHDLLCHYPITDHIAAV